MIDTINEMIQNDKFIILYHLFSYIMTEICSKMVQNQPVSHAPYWLNYWHNLDNKCCQYLLYVTELQSALRKKYNVPLFNDE